MIVPDSPLQTSLPSDHYSFHELSIRIESDSQAIRTAIRSRLNYFSRPSAANPAQLVIGLHGGQDDDGPEFPTLPPGVRSLYSPSASDRFDIRRLGLEHLQLFLDEAGGDYWLDLGSLGLVRYNLQSGRATGRITHPERLHPALISGGIFAIVFNEMLKSQGYFPHHSAGVAKAGKAVLLPGFSGSGKTTSCLALVRSGYRFISDDKTVIRVCANGSLEALSYPESVDVTDRTIDFFPELKQSPALISGLNLSKKSFYLPDIYPAGIQDRSRPTTILFPQIGSRRSTIVALPKKEALDRLLPHGLLVFDKEAARRHFNLLCELIETCRTWTLCLGADLERVGDMVDAIL